jgi:DNA repair exonuclease SbcCD ATPase subunit
MGELRIFNSLSLQNSIIQNVISKIETRINETFLDIIRKWKEVNINTTSQLGEELINEYKNNDKPIDTLSLMELFREIYKFIDDSIRNSMKYEVIYPKITSFFIDHLKNQYNKERQKYNEERQKLISEKESLENLLTQHKKMNETLKNERDKEIERLKQDCQNVRLDLEARIDEKNKMIKTIQSSNDNVINDLKGNISELQLQIENKNKELKYKVGYGVAGQGGKGGSSMISDSIVEGVLLKLDTFKDNLFRAEIDKVKLSLKQEISYRVEGLQEEFMKKVSLLKKDCEKLVLQVKTDSKREIEEYKQIIKNQYDELTDFKCQINGQDYKIELYKEKIISYEKEKKTQQEHAELLKLLTLKLNTLMENISKKL